jgi:hypothetical protein
VTDGVAVGVGIAAARRRGEAVGVGEGVGVGVGVDHSISSSSDSFETAKCDDVVDERVENITLAVGVTVAPLITITRPGVGVGVG